MTRTEAAARVIEAARKRRDLEHVNVVFPREYEAWDKEWTAATIEFDDALALYDSTPNSEGGWRPRPHDYVGTRCRNCGIEYNRITTSTWCPSPPTQEPTP